MADDYRLVAAAFHADLDRQVKDAHTAGGFTAVLALAEHQLAQLDADRIAGRLTVDGWRWRAQQWSYTADRSREYAANEALGWTILADGSVAKMQDDGTVLSARGGVRYEEDGVTVDTFANPRSIERHQQLAREYGAQVRRDRRPARASRTRRETHGNRRSRRVAAARRRTEASDDGSDSDGPAEGGLTVEIVGAPSAASDAAVARWFERFLTNERPGTTWTVRDVPARVDLGAALEPDLAEWKLEDAA